MSQRRSVLIGLLIVLLIIGIWWTARQQNEATLTTLYSTGTAHYHQIETQVYATWTP